MENRRMELMELNMTALRLICKENGISYSTKNKKLTKAQVIDKILMHERAGEKAEEILAGEAVKQPVIVSNKESKEIIVESKEPVKNDYTKSEKVVLIRHENMKREIIPFKNYSELEKELAVIVQKYEGHVDPQFLDNIKNTDFVVFVHHVEAKDGNIYKKLRTAKVFAINRKKQCVRVRTIIGNEIELSYSEILYVKRNDKTSDYPLDIDIFLKRQRTEKGRKLIDEKYKEISKLAGI